MIRQALVEALPERAPYPLAQGLPELREAAAGWLERRFGVGVDPDTEIVPTYGSKEAIFSLAQVLGTERARGGVRRAGVPGVRARRALRRSAGADAAVAARERLPSRSRRARRRRRARLGQLPAQPDRRGRAARVLRRARGGRRAPRLRRRLGRGVYGAVVRRAAAVGAPGGRPLAHRRLPDAEQALVDDRLPLRVRRRAAGDRGRTEGVPSDRGHRAAGVRAARIRRRRGTTSATSRRPARAIARSETC